MKTFELFTVRPQRYNEPKPHEVVWRTVQADSFTVEGNAYTFRKTVGLYTPVIIETVPFYAVGSMGALCCREKIAPQKCKECGHES